MPPAVTWRGKFARPPCCLQWAPVVYATRHSRMEGLVDPCTSVDCVSALTGNTQYASTTPARGISKMQRNGYGKQSPSVRWRHLRYNPPSAKRETKVKTKNWRHTRYLRRGPSLPPDGSGQVQNLSRQFFQAAYMHFEARTRAPGDSRRYLAPVGGQKTGSRPIPKGEGVHN